MWNLSWHNVEEGIQVLGDSHAGASLISAICSLSNNNVSCECPEDISFTKEFINALVRISAFLNSSVVTVIPRLGIKEKLGCNRIEALDFNGNNGILKSGRGALKCPRQCESITITAAMLEW